MLQEKAKLQESLGDPWVQYDDPKFGMFCTLGKKWECPLSRQKGGWTTKGIVDRNCTTELQKLNSGFKWHQDSLITATIAKHVVQQNIIEMQYAGPAKQVEEQKKKNHENNLKLRRSI